jgi:hypothetical protein
VIYPATLVLPDHPSYSGAVDLGLLRTSAGGGVANQMLSFNSPTQMLSLSFSMDNDEYFNNWLPWVVANAYWFFEMPVISINPPVDIMSSQLVRFASDIEYLKRGDDWITLGVSVEIMYGQPADPLS